jgi:hypothetical protein
MREPHPIDDLFRRALSQAEATPPPAVWNSVMRQRHFGHRLLTRLERKWGWRLLLPLLLGGSVTTWALRGTSTDRTSATAEAIAIDQATDPGRTTAPTGPVALVSSSSGPKANDSGRAHTTIEGATTKTSPRSANDPSTGKLRSGGSMNAEPSATRSTSGGRPTKVLAKESGAGRTAAPDDVPTSHDATASFVVAAATDRTDHMYLGLLSCRPVAWGAWSAPDTKLPAGSDASVYVMPAGQWVLGLQFMHGPATGEWRGSGRAIGELNDAELWRTHSSLAVIGGRRWVDGWGLFVGAEYAKRSSRFLRARTLPGALSANLDTSWTATTIGATTYSTWNIDTLFTEEPGAPSVTSTRNRYAVIYGMVQVEYERRLGGRFALNGGLQTRIGGTISRMGRTLLASTAVADSGETSTQEPEVVDLGVASVRDRFGTVVDLGLAVDIGYQLGDRCTLRIGPYWRRIVRHGQNLTLSSNSFGGLVRFDYAFLNSARMKPMINP